MKDLRRSIQQNVSPKGTCYSVFGDAEPVIVFIHGVGMNQHVWQSQVDYFCKDHTVVVYDMLGHGNSPLPPEDVQLQSYSDQLLELLEHLNINQAIIVGHSTGALISVEFALQNPGKVKALVPINIVYKRDNLQSQNVLVRANQVLEEEQITGIDITLNRWFSNKTDQSSLDKIAIIRDYLSRVNPIGYGRTYKMFAQSDKVFVDRLDQLKAPVLCLTGDNDSNSTPWMSEQIANESPQGEFRSLADEAHMMAYISHEKVNPVIEKFIASVMKKSEG